MSAAQKPKEPRRTKREIPLEKYISKDAPPKRRLKGEIFEDRSGRVFII